MNGTVNTASLLDEALELQRQGALEPAAERCRLLLQAEPGNIEALYCLAQISCQQGDLAKGLALAREVVDLAPPHARAHVLLGMALNALGRPQDAVASFDQAIAYRPDLAGAHGGRADALLELGRLNDAIGSYQRALELQPQSFENWCNQGAALHQLGRYQEAVASYERALRLKPEITELRLSIGNALVQLGCYEEAVKAYDDLLAIAPAAIDGLINQGEALIKLKRPQEALERFARASSLNPADSRSLLGSAASLIALGRFEEALSRFQAVLAQDPAHVDALNGCGFALNALDRYREALAASEQSLAIRSDQVDALNNRGNALCGLGRHEEGMASYEAALAIAPNHVETLANLGYALNALCRPLESLRACQQALNIQPEHVGALNILGNALIALNRGAEALAAYDRALMIRPGDANAANNRGNALFALNRLEEALASYEGALRSHPDSVDALYNRGMCQSVLNQWREATASFDRLLAIKPDHGAARIGRCMAQLPILYADESEIAERRSAYELRLKELSDYVEQLETAENLAKAVGSMQPFYLAYQGRSDHDLQQLYGSLVRRIIAARHRPATLPPSPNDDEPIRVGIVSGFFFDHSVWKIPVRGWVSQLDRRRFRLFGYHTGRKSDAETRAAAALFERFVQGPLTVDGWRQAILADAPHVLIYPELGMDPLCPPLAAQRLAKTQCTSWGHPDTSGFPTLDYYLSSDLMEPADGETHYTETLVRLPHLSSHYELVGYSGELAPVPELVLRPSATVYWSPQSLFKYLPQFDHVFPAIAREAGDCQFVFIEDRSRNVTDLFRQRLDRAFAASGLDSKDYCVVLPRLDQARFHAAMRQCHVFLDSIGWSGCNTALESLSYDMPIVAFAGMLMRGRHTMAMMEIMGISETVAHTIEAYVAIAGRLARDLRWRQTIRDTVRTNKHRLYRDLTSVRALEIFLERVARERAPVTSPGSPASRRVD